MEQDAAVILRDLVGRSIPTLSGKTNQVLGIEADLVRVGTARSPGGELVEVAQVQRALDRLLQEGSIKIDKREVGYRSAFVGAVLRSLPGVSFSLRPARVYLQRDAPRAPGSPA
ncbi:MAG: hypothetical protein HUU15_14835 [Candidatus Brocadiae bacterium]|nr:hypothetical protein [Candidatus Brocadiia bacterium]